MHDDLIRRRLELFPLGTQIIERQESNTLAIAGCRLDDLAEQFGTPLYLYDRRTLDAGAEAYTRALEEFYPGPGHITYAAKAFLCLAITQWTQLHDFWIDCTSAAEIEIARAGGVPAKRILLHGVNKSLQDVDLAFKQAAVVVVDHLGELEQVMQLSAHRGEKLPEIWLRLRPGLTVDTHAHTQTANPRDKFGMDFAEAELAVRACMQAGLPLTGLHFHLGSHFHNPAPLAPAIEGALDFVVKMHAASGWMPESICPGGGWGVAYHEDDLPQPDIRDYIRFVSSSLESGCRRRGLPLPILQLEPGRSLVARAGVAIYCVGAIKNAAGRRWILLDGGMADNPRLALYGARYSALPISEPGRAPNGPAWLGGRYCESGDVLAGELLMPELSPGELVAVPVSGAYQLSMSSNYNGALKPAVLWLQDGHAYLIQQRQTVQDLLRNDLPLPAGTAPERITG